MEHRGGLKESAARMLRFATGSFLAGGPGLTGGVSFATG